MKILHVCAEFYPLLKTGGLADVTGALPKAQVEQGHDARILIPAFPAIKAGVTPTDLVREFDSFAGRVTLRYGHYEGVGIYLLDAPHLYDRPGSPYHDSYQHAYADNHIRFALLSWVAAEMVAGLDAFWRPELVHCHDWHAGLACAYLMAKKADYPVKSVFTIHNLAYQGNFAAYHLPELQLPYHYFDPNGLEFYGQLSYLKAGLFYADQITAVSPTYAQEILQPEYAYGFEGLLRDRYHQGRLKGILNGIDEAIWDPRQDKLIEQRYNKRNLKSKIENKAALQAEFNLTMSNRQPLFAVVSRLVYQKGLDLVLARLPAILASGAQFILLGSGDDNLQQAFEQLSQQPENQGNIAIHLGYNEALSHRIIAGADVLMVPSRFEPCGLTQLYALKYGTLPLVHHTGGLADTVIDSSEDNISNKSATGFVFYDCKVDAMQLAIDRAGQLWQNQRSWRQVQQQAMSKNFSWHESAKQYLALYHTLLG